MKEYKFLIEMPNLEELQNKFPNFKEIKSTKSYLKMDNSNKVYNITKWEINDVTKYYFAEKPQSNPLDDEISKEITETEYNNYSNKIDKTLNIVHKVQYNNIYPFENQFVKIEIYHFWKAYAVLKISTDGQPIVPSDLKAVRDITNDNRFSNYNLARNIKICLYDYKKDTKIKLASTLRDFTQFSKLFGTFKYHNILFDFKAQFDLTYKQITMDNSPFFLLYLSNPKKNELLIFRDAGRVTYNPITYNKQFLIQVEKDLLKQLKSYLVY